MMQERNSSRMCPQAAPTLITYNGWHTEALWEAILAAAQASLAAQGTSPTLE